MVAVRNYIDNSPTTNFPAGINATDNTAVVSSLVGFPTSFPYPVTLDLGQSTAEVVLFTGAVGLTVTMTRNWNGQGAFAHLSTGTINHTATALDYTEANQHHVSTSAHGTTSAVVGINDTQTITNKTFSNLVAQGVSSSAAGTFNVSGTSDGWRVVNAGTTKAKADVNGVISSSGLVNTGTITSTGQITTSGGAITALGTFTSTGGGVSVATGISGASVSVTGNVGAATVTTTSTVAATGAVTGASFAANGNGTVAGVLAPKSYTNEAAVASPATGMIVYLTAPTGTGYGPGLFTYDGTTFRPVQQGTWVSYVPAWTAAGTAPVVGNGTLTGAVCVIGRSVFFRLRFTAGSSTTYGSGAWFFSLPIARSASDTFDGISGLYVNTSANRHLLAAQDSSTTTFSMQCPASVTSGVSATIPVAAASGMTVEMRGTYEI